MCGCAFLAVHVWRLVAGSSFAAELADEFSRVPMRNFGGLCGGQGTEKPYSMYSA